MTRKEAQRRLAAAVREQQAAQEEVRRANARVVEATSKLPPHYVDEHRRFAPGERDRIQKLVDVAQRASDRSARATSNVVNLRGLVASQDAQKTARGGAKGPRAHAAKKTTPAQLDREIAEVLSKKLTPAQRDQYQARRRFGHPAALAFKAAAGRELSRVPPRSKRAHAAKKATPRVAYRLKLTPSEVSAVEFARGRYQWPDMLAVHMAEDGSVAFSESEMWQWVDDVESDEAGGHSPFPLASRSLAGKLQDFRDSVV